MDHSASLCFRTYACCACGVHCRRKPEVQLPNGATQPIVSFLVFAPNGVTVKPAKAATLDCKDPSGQTFDHPQTALPATLEGDQTNGVTRVASQDLQQRQQLLTTIQREDRVISWVAVGIASVTGLLTLYVGKTFGTLADYATALIWGFGVDAGVKGFAATLKKLTIPAA